MTEPAAHIAPTTQTEDRKDLVSPAARIATVLGTWGGIVGLVAIVAAWNRGVSDAAALGAVTVFVSATAGIGLLVALGMKPVKAWAFPMLGVQLLRTLLAPALGLAVFFAAGLLDERADAVAFWMTLLAVAAAMLAGETIAAARMLGAPAHPHSGGAATTGREAVA